MFFIEACVCNPLHQNQLKSYKTCSDVVIIRLLLMKQIILTISKTIEEVLGEFVHQINGGGGGGLRVATDCDLRKCSYCFDKEKIFGLLNRYLFIYLSGSPTVTEVKFNS